MKNRLLYTFVLLAYSVTCLSTGHAYTFRGITMSDGLSDLLVNVIYKDSNGFVWLGTDNCLDRFDGMHIKHYPFEGADIKRKRVNAIIEGTNQELWVGNNMGLWRLAPEKEALQPMYPDVISFPVYSLLASNGTLYIGTEKGLFTLRDEQLTHYLPDENLLAQGNRIKAICAGVEDDLWLATANGLYRFHPTDDTFRLYRSDTAKEGGNTFRNITRIDKTLYLGTENQGLFSFETENGRFAPFIDVGSKIISSLSSDGTDCLYVATDGNGIHFLSHRNRNVIHSFQARINDRMTIRSNSVYSLLVDKEGIVWVGFYQAGFDYTLYQNGLFNTYAFPPLFDSKNRTVRSFLIHGNKKLIGTRDGLYYIDEDALRLKVFQMPELRSNLIFAIHYYNSKFYIGTYGGGLSLIDPQTLRVESFSGSKDMTFVNGHIFCMRQDVSGNLWIGTSNGVYCYEVHTGDIRHFNHTNSQMPEGNTYEIFFDSTGKGWVCTDNGMAVYDPQTLRMRSDIFPADFFHKEKIRTVYEDSRKKLYFLPDRGGLFISDLSMRRYERQAIHPILHGNAYTTIMEDNDGWIWLGSDDGMIRQKEGNKQFYTFNFTDGIPDPTFMYPSYKDASGVLWFSNNKGLLTVNPAEVDSIKRDPYKIVLTEIRLNGVLLSWETVQEAKRHDLLKLPSDKKTIGFRFANLSYTDPAAVIYYYKLEGLDSEWKLLSANNEINYYDLKPGKYSLRVRIPGDEQSEMNIHLQMDAWWETYQAGLLVAFFLILQLALAGWYYRRRKLRLKHSPVVMEKNPAESVEQEKYRMNKLSEKECKTLHEALIAYMESERPYTNPDLKIADLAKAIDSSSFSLSYLFNQYLNQSYYDFINHYRVEAFKKLVVDPDYSKYTLTALASLSGFSSRASFFRSFKKATGITPNEYIQQLD